MNTETKLLSISTMLSAALFLTFSASQASVETTQAPNDATVTKIKMNGLNFDVMLNDGDTNGYLNASRDEIANTSALDFTYAFPHPTDPDLAILVQGVGEIPNSAFTTTSTTAHLAVTTSFPINRCVVNLVTAEINCATTTPSTFHLSWTKNSLGSVIERTKRTETLGPVTSKFNGQFKIFTATVTGIWDGHTAADLTGNLLDTQSKTVIREVTMEGNP